MNNLKKYKPNGLLKRLTLIIGMIIIIISFVFLLNIEAYAQDNDGNSGATGDDSTGATNDGSSGNGTSDNGPPAKEEELKFIFKAALDVEGIVINSDPYLELATFFEFGYYKFKAGLELDIRINKGGKLSLANWDDLADWIAKISYITWGDKGEKPVYVNFGIIDAYSFGHGTLVSAFSNTKNEPSYERRGLIFDLDVAFLGVESLISDVTTGPIAGLRLFFRPFSFITKAPKIVKDIEIGVTYITDTDPDVLLAKDATGIITETTINAVFGGMSALGFDAGLAVVSNPNALDMVVYIDFNMLLGLGSGLHFGVYGSIVPAKVDLFYKFEMIISFGNYIHSYFNDRYYTQRGAKYLELQNALNSGAHFGINFLFGKVFVNKKDQFIRFAIGGSEMFGDNIGGELELNLIMYGIIPGLNIDISYLVWNIFKLINIVDFDGDQAISITLGYQIKKAIFELSYVRSFIFNSVTLVFDPVDTISVKTEFFF